MQVKDVREAARTTAAHRILAARYGPRLADLERVWFGLLRLDATRCAIFEETHGADLRIVGVGFATFVSDDFVREMKATPLRWIANEVMDRIVQGKSPVLSNAQLREANSTTGLNVAVWQSGIRVEEFRAELVNEATISFNELHRGFLLKELITQADCVETWVIFRDTGRSLGLRFFNTVNGSYGEYPEECDIMHPHLLGITRELASFAAGSWAGSLFFYQSPRVGFNRSEQRLLLAALEGGTDEELADRLRISISAIKKTWHSIYERVGTCLPQLLPNSEADAEPSGRGKGKKQRLLAYVRDHPEELRPVSRRLLKGTAEGPSRPVLDSALRR
jgi:DNA-binding CsgD family transcriptional regulator